MKKPTTSGYVAVLALLLAAGPAAAQDDSAGAGTSVEEDAGSGGGEAGGGEVGAEGGSGSEAEGDEGSAEDDEAGEDEAEAAPGKAKLLLPVSEVGAAVFLDGKEVGISPLPSIGGLTIGKHELTVKKDGFFEYAGEVDIPADGSVRHDVLLASSARKDVKVPPILKKWWLWTIIGAVVVTGAGVGIYYGTRPAEPDGVPMPPY